MTKITRPVLRYHGGKFRLAPWIISHFPAHRIYVEPFGGAASVLMRKPRCYAEIYNDLDNEVVTLFEVLRSSRAGELIETLRLTPYARTEFMAAYKGASDQVEIARRLVVRSFMGFGSDGCTSDIKTGFRANSNRSGSTPAHDWANLPSALAACVDRLSGVVIERRDAATIMRAHDGAATLHYVDPPYLPETRSQKVRRGGALHHAYRHEMTKDDHVRLLDALRELRGMVVLSGYPSALYDDALFDWRRVAKTAMADGARERKEVLWINPAASINAKEAAHG